jgi:PAS domain S-box-containing protein
LLRVVGSGEGDQFEIDSDDRNLKLGATAFGDILALTVSDVTALKRREASFRLLFDNNPMPMWVFDAETTRFLGVNDAAVQHYGYSRETFLAMMLQEIWPEDERINHKEALLNIGDTYQSSRNWRHIKADGSEIHVLTFGRRVAFDGCDGYLVAVVDITERRKAEARIAYMAHHDGLTRICPTASSIRSGFARRWAKLKPMASGWRCCASILTCSRTSTIPSAIPWGIVS